MLWWLETQETPVIVLIVFVFCYLPATLILVGLAVLSRSRLAGALHVTSPSMVSALGVILGLVIAFLAARVWATVDHDHRLRKRYSALLREKVGRTVSDAAEVDEEIHSLCKALVASEGGLGP